MKMHLEKLGDLVADHVDREALMRMIDEGQPERLPFVSSQLSAFSGQQAVDGVAGEEGSRLEDGEVSVSTQLAFTTPSGVERRSTS